MDQQPENTTPQPPRRRKRSKIQTFKETLLPVIIAGVAVTMIFVFIVGAIVTSVIRSQRIKAENEEAARAYAVQLAELTEQQDNLLIEAAALARSYDYDGALAVLDSFTGDPSNFPALTSKRDEYASLKSQLVAWDEPGEVVNLSLQMLIADSKRAFNDDTYAYSFSRNFLTTTEFSRILEQLYANGYILVNLSDFITTETTDTGATVYTTKPLYLPEGKKPLVITQTNVNYHTYLTDGNGDKKPDQAGCGFASRLVFDENGEITCEYVDGKGKTVTGNYDMIPILNEFVKNHPDFSYRGAKAVIAVTGYDGLFGYRTNAEAQQTFGKSIYESEIASAKAIAEKLRADGYEIACYTYENEPYGDFSAEQIKADLSGWTSEVITILGNVDVFVFAQNSDIAPENSAFSGEKYNLLRNAGFKVFLGFCSSGKPWFMASDNYVRQGRIMLTPSNIRHRSSWFKDILDTNKVLDADRGNVPI